MREFVNIPEPSLDFQVAEDMARVLVEEQGYKPGLKTLGLAVLMRCLARLKVSSKAVLAKVDHNYQDEVWRRTMQPPRQLAFWINTLVGAAGRERHVADMRYVHARRSEELLLTSLDK